MPSLKGMYETQNCLPVSLTYLLRMRYFTASRQMIDIAQCQNIFALQTVVFMTLFLHSSASMPTCHSYISVAMAASLQMGLHCSQPAEMDPVERETRKRLFWTIRTLETYIVVILGLPRTISDDDIDQEMPLEIDDEYITKEGIFPMPEGRVSLITASNAHIRLAHILGKVSTDVYPAKRMQKEASQKTRAYIVNNAKVHEVENDLQSWMMSLPTHLRPGPSASKDLTRYKKFYYISNNQIVITANISKSPASSTASIYPCSNNSLQTVPPLHFPISQGQPH